MTAAALRTTKRRKWGNIRLNFMLTLFTLMAVLQTTYAVASSTESPITSSPAANDLQYSTENANLPSQNNENENYEVIDVSAKQNGADEASSPRTGQTTRIFTSGEVDDKFWMKHLGDDFKYAVHLQVGDNDQLTGVYNVSRQDSADGGKRQRHRQGNDKEMDKLLHANNLTDVGNSNESHANKRSSFPSEKNLDNDANSSQKSKENDEGPTKKRPKLKQPKRSRSQGRKHDASEGQNTSDYEKVFVLDEVGFDLMKKLEELKQSSKDMSARRENYAKLRKSYLGKAGKKKTFHRQQAAPASEDSQRSVSVSSPYAPIVVELPEDPKTIEHTEDDGQPVVLNMPPVVYQGLSDNDEANDKQPYGSSDPGKFEQQSYQENYAAGMPKEYLAQQHGRGPYIPNESSKHQHHRRPPNVPAGPPSEFLGQQHLQQYHPHGMHGKGVPKHREYYSQAQSYHSYWPPSFQQQLPRPDTQNLQAYPHLHPHTMKAHPQHYHNPNTPHTQERHSPHQPEHQHNQHNTQHQYQYQMPPNYLQYPPHHTQHNSPQHHQQEHDRQPAAYRLQAHEQGHSHNSQLNFPPHHLKHESQHSEHDQQQHIGQPLNTHPLQQRPAQHAQHLQEKTQNLHHTPHTPHNAHVPQHQQQPQHQHPKPVEQLQDDPQAPIEAAHSEIINEEVAANSYKQSLNKKPVGRFILRKPTIPYDSPSVFEIPLSGSYA